MLSAIRQAIDAMNRNDLTAALELLEPHEDQQRPQDPEHFISYATAARDWITLACHKLRKTINKEQPHNITAVVPVGLALRTALALLTTPGDAC